MLQVNFIMIYIIHEILVLLKIIQIIRISNVFSKSVIDFYLYKKDTYFLLQHLMMKSLRLEKENDRRKHN